jgi:hypothetical protein
MTSVSRICCNSPRDAADGAAAEGAACCGAGEGCAAGGALAFAGPCAGEDTAWPLITARPAGTPREDAGRFSAARAVAAGFDATSITRWQKHMDPLLKRWFAAWCRPALARFGYPVEMDRKPVGND